MGAKIQLGGLKLGLFSVKYQLFTELCVTTLLKKPIVEHITMPINM